MKPVPAHFDLDSDKDRQDAFGRELDRIDEQHRRTDRRKAAARATPRHAKRISKKAAQRAAFLCVYSRGSTASLSSTSTSTSNTH